MDSSFFSQQMAPWCPNFPLSKALVKIGEKRGPDEGGVKKSDILNGWTPFEIFTDVLGASWFLVPEIFDWVAKLQVFQTFLWLLLPQMQSISTNNIQLMNILIFIIFKNLLLGNSRIQIYLVTLNETFISKRCGHTTTIRSSKHFSDLNWKYAIMRDSRNSKD